MSNSFTQEFAGRHPQVVANLLNQGDLQETVEFLQSLGQETLLAVLTRLDDLRLRSVLAGLDDGALAGLIANSDQESFIALVAQVPNHRYPNIIAVAADERVAARLQGFSDATLGAVASAEFISTNAKQTIASLRDQLANADFADDDPIIVLGQDKEVIGILSPLALLVEANQSKSVGSLVESVEPLDELTPISQAVASRLWQSHKVLPVASTSKQLLGVVRLQQLLKIAETSPQPESQKDMVSVMLQQYFLVCGDLLALLFSRPTK